ncbi:TPA: D-tyrosyl-tRNA(Tyr) deacylase [Candidatus Gastranaerophilales bacterium HUM_21]|nr:MAG TPA: D-tyrosyl-tRNA(Tyr) deacylase [Candidatus Gastranaerophilales bacterium HUM_21]
MKAVLQRVKKASVTIDGEIYSSINAGMLVLLCVEKEDTKESLDWMVNKILSLRCFEDENNKMNKSLIDINGEILAVSQFTLAADCKKGTRPSFDKAEAPEKAKAMYEQFVTKLKESNLCVKTGVFAAMMDVSLVNDGPVTFVLEK